MSEYENNNLCHPGQKEPPPVSQCQVEDSLFEPDQESQYQDNIVDTPDIRPALPEHKKNIRVKPKDLCMTTRQLATLLRAGMPLVPALTALAEQLQQQGRSTHAHPMHQIIQHLADRVNTGASLADALQEYLNIFSNLFINMVRAGQTSGTLEEVLIKLADMLEKRVRLTAKIRAALAYPALMAITAAAVVAFLMAFVVPGISKIFIDMNRQLPWPTTMLISISTFFRAYLVVIAIAVCVFIFAVVTYLKTKTGKMKWDQLKLKLPLIGDLFLKVETVRLTRTLGIMLSSGIPILDALKIVKGVIQNSFIAASLDNIKQDIGTGLSTAGAIKQTGLFPPIIYHTVAIGEMSGNMEEQLINIADDYDDQIDTMARSLTSLIEPVILLLMGLVVGFIVLAMLLPIFEINQML